MIAVSLLFTSQGIFPTTNVASAPSAGDSYGRALLLDFRSYESQGRAFDWFFECAVRRLSNIDYATMGVWLGMVGLTHREMWIIHSEMKFRAALLTLGLQRSEADSAPVFVSMGEAEAWLDEPGMVWPCEALASALLHHNPNFSKARASSQTKGTSERLTEISTVKAWKRAPAPPQNDFDLMMWAAWWCGAVARDLGLLRECQRGDRSAIREVARSLPSVAGMIEQQEQERADALALSVARLYQRNGEF